MRPSQPPALALRLMNIAGADPAVIGDLVETYATGRRAAWFWRQALAASAPAPIDALRWAMAIPLAVYTSNVLERQSYRFLWAVLDTHVRAPLGWRYRLAVCVGVFLSSAALVLIGALMVPTRRRLVATCLLSIVCVEWGLVTLIELARPFVMAGQPFGGPYHWTTFEAVASGLLGGFVAYWMSPKQLN